MAAKSEPSLPTIDCEHAAGEIRAFAGSSMPAARGRILRKHLLQCAECKALYRDVVETAASLGHNLRSGREDLESERAVIRRAAYRSIDKIRQEKPNTFALRMILIPAFFFFLMVFVTKIAWPDDKVKVKDFGGAVFLGEDSFLPDGPAGLILRGSWLTTNERAFLELKLGSSSVRLDELTFLLVEDPARHRFRLRNGTLELSGLAQVTTTRGILEMEEGTARLGLHGSNLELTCETGEVVFLDALGKTRLSAGEKLVRGVR